MFYRAVIWLFYDCQTGFYHELSYCVNSVPVVLILVVPFNVAYFTVNHLSGILDSGGFRVFLVSLMECFLECSKGILIVLSRAQGVSRMRQRSFWVFREFSRV